jgi:hypothetical protein
MLTDDHHQPSTTSVQTILRELSDRGKHKYFS